MTLYPLVLEMKKLLGHMNDWIDKAEAHAASKGYDANILLQARLAPDMFPLVRQFQNACDTAKFAAAFATGKEPPVTPGHRADRSPSCARGSPRSSSTSARFTPGTSRGRDRARGEAPAMGRQVDDAPPTTSSSTRSRTSSSTSPRPTRILRHNGVDLGKRDYLGKLSLR